MQLAAQRLGSAEEDAGLRRRVDLADALEDGVPVRTAVVCGRAQTRDGVLLGVGVVEHDVGRVVGSDLRGEVLRDMG